MTQVYAALPHVDITQGRAVTTPTAYMQLMDTTYLPTYLPHGSAVPHYPNQEEKRNPGSTLTRVESEPLTAAGPRGIIRVRCENISSFCHGAKHAYTKQNKKQTS